MGVQLVAVMVAHDQARGARKGAAAGTPHPIVPLLITWAKQSKTGAHNMMTKGQAAAHL